MSVHIVLNVPQVQGKSSEFRCALMDGVGRFVCGCERFWIRRNLPGFPDLGTSESGEDWNGPISLSSSSFVKGPRYRPLSNSTCIISLKTFFNVSVEFLLGGA